MSLRALPSWFRSIHARGDRFQHVLTLVTLTGDGRLGEADAPLSTTGRTLALAACERRAENGERRAERRGTALQWRPVAAADAHAPDPVPPYVSARYGGWPWKLYMGCLVACSLSTFSGRDGRQRRRANTRCPVLHAPCSLHTVQGTAWGARPRGPQPARV